jgi:deoxyribodipyrimidine photolyase-related protein
MGKMKTTVWILGDQLLLEHPALQEARKFSAMDSIRVLLIESRRRLQKRPYQKKKLVLLLSAMRHYAQSLRDQGFQVEVIQGENFTQALRDHVDSWQPDQLITMEASEYAGRQFQRESLASRLERPVIVVPNSMFLVERHNPYPEAAPEQKVVMEHFYRRMRRHFKVLIDQEGEPAGGEWNYDKMNREPLPSGVNPPSPISFEPDDITRDVMGKIDALGSGIGSTDGFTLGVTHGQAQEAVQDFLSNRLQAFGPYEDAMSRSSSTLFHSILSPYLNVGLLDPLDLVKEVEAAYHTGAAPINSVEGFIRQVLGWREFIYWHYWRQMPGLQTANSWSVTRPMPAAFWDGETAMNCVRHVAGRVMDTGYSHHIERLMVVCNYCMLAGVDPGQVAAWFLSFYIDAFEWVVLPNVIGMGLNADGGLTATKPYIASANYINRMGDYCPSCPFDAKDRSGEQACPFNFLYWNFLITHEKKLRANPRLGPNVLALRHIDSDERKVIQRRASAYLERLSFYEAGA